MKQWADYTIESLLQQAIDTWGEDAQVSMAIEECSELITALTQFWRGRKTKAEVAEEIADVSIMMRQLRLIFGYQEVNEIEAGKLARLKKRLAKETPADNGASPDIVRDMLLLSGIDVPEAIIETWTPSQRYEAQVWAAKAHLQASDNPVKAGPMPDFINQAQRTQ